MNADTNYPLTNSRGHETINMAGTSNVHVKGIWMFAATSQLTQLVSYTSRLLSRLCFNLF